MPSVSILDPSSNRSNGPSIHFDFLLSAMKRIATSSQWLSAQDEYERTKTPSVVPCVQLREALSRIANNASEEEVSLRADFLNR
jgi:hypothetical protein